MDCINAKRDGGPKTPLYEGKGPEKHRRRGAICCCELSRQLQARSGKTDGEDRPTSLPSSSTVVIQFIDKVLNLPDSSMSTHLSSVTLGTPSLEVMVFVYPCREAKLSKKLTERVRRLPGESHGHSVFVIFSARLFCT